MLVHFVSDDNSEATISEEGILDAIPAVGTFVKLHGSMFTVTSTMLVIQTASKPFYRVALLETV